MKFARRVQNLPPYLFAEIDRMIDKAKARGVDVISFGIGDPDQPTPRRIVDKAVESVQNSANHSYPNYIGMKSFRQAYADFYERRFNVTLNPDTEIIGLIGSKEGIAHLPLCLLNPGDIALVPDPAYPVYKTATILSNGIPYPVPLLKENGFLPDLDKIDDHVARMAKLMFLNYPNNPTGAVASRDFFEAVVQFAIKYDVVLAHDAAYSEIVFDNCKVPSILEIPKAKEIAVEFHSLSKTYNMTGWRIGVLVGNSEVVNTLGRVKSNIDSGIFKAIQYAAIEALKGSQTEVAQLVKMYRERRDFVCNSFRELGWSIEPCQATFYLWIPVPGNMTSENFSKEVFKKTGVFFTPGVGYGEYGEGYIRLSLTLKKERIGEAFQRIRKSGIRYQ